MGFITIKTNMYNPSCYDRAKVIRDRIEILEKEISQHKEIIEGMEKSILQLSAELETF